MQLLERRRGTSAADMAENVECLCHFMTTVGEKLDTHKAKVHMYVMIKSYCMEDIFMYYCY